MQIQKKTILIAEDEPSMQRIVSDRLIESGFEVIATNDGYEGLRLALTKHPDLILLDILMPKMTGMEMLKRLRDDAWGKTAPVILLTNVSPDTDKALQEVIAYQPAYYFIKSDVQLTDIVEKIKEIVSPNN